MLSSGPLHPVDLERRLLFVSGRRFCEHDENVVLLGPLRVGKTHLAVGLGLKAIEAGYRVLFTTATGMIGTLTKALAEGRLEAKLKLYTVPRLLIIHELGYLPIAQSDPNPSSSSSAAATRWGHRS